MMLKRKWNWENSYVAIRDKCAKKNYNLVIEKDKMRQLRRFSVPQTFQKNEAGSHWDYMPLLSDTFRII